MTNTNNPTAPALTFAHLVALEPELGDLLAEVASLKPDPSGHFCANAAWYGYQQRPSGFRKRLSQLVGHLSGLDGVLGTSRAYDIAYQTLYQALPDCRHGGCCGPHGTRDRARSHPLATLMSD